MARLQERVRIGIVGLGWVGQEVARAAMEDPRVKLVGVADSDPAKAGRDLGEIIGEGRLGVRIEANVSDLLSRARPEVAVLCTSSEAAGQVTTVEACIAHGAHVVSTCENLADPEILSDRTWARLDARAREKRLVILASGVNPGFAMDRLPVMLTQATRNVRRVRVLRIVNVASRRAQLQSKVGVGLTPKTFGTAMQTGAVGHAGLGASLRLIAKGLGVTLDKSALSLRPLIAEYPLHSPVLGPIEAGRVRGVYQVARGYRGRRELITLELTIALDEPHARDVVDIIGEPPIHFEGELPGDACTVATVLSAIPVVVTMQPGLRTVLEVPLEQPEEPPPESEVAVGRGRRMTQLPTKVAVAEGAPSEPKRGRGKKPEAAKAEATAPASPAPEAKEPPTAKAADGAKAAGQPEPARAGGGRKAAAEAKPAGRGRAGRKAAETVEGKSAREAKPAGRARAAGKAAKGRTAAASKAAARDRAAGKAAKGRTAAASKAAGGGRVGRSAADKVEAGSAAGAKAAGGGRAGRSAADKVGAGSAAGGGRAGRSAADKVEAGTAAGAKAAGPRRGGRKAAEKGAGGAAEAQGARAASGDGAPAAQAEPAAPVAAPPPTPPKDGVP